VDLNGSRFDGCGEEEHRRDESPVPNRRRRAILRAAAISPVILTVPGKLARAQAQKSFGTSLCAPLGLQKIISAGDEPQASSALRECKRMLGIQ
jgi:hypothetical protein